MRLRTFKLSALSFQQKRLMLFGVWLDFISLNKKIIPAYNSAGEQNNCFAFVEFISRNLLLW